MSDRSEQTVSVVMPCYNGAPYLREAIESAIGQTHRPLEVLVIDDGSTDESAAIAASYGEPVRVIRQTNQGESVARNHGIEEARGDWIAFLDADDIWRPTKLERQLAAAGADVVAVHTNYNFFGVKDEQIDMSIFTPAERYDLARVCLLKNKHFNMSSLTVRAGLPARFPTWTRFGEDLMYFAELLLAGAGRIELVTEDLVCTRRHGKNQSSPASAQLEWHTTIERWTAENRGRLGDALAEQIRDGLVTRLVAETDIRYWQRDWPAYWEFRRFLEKYSQHPEVERLLAQRVYPRWTYAIKDWFERGKQDDRNHTAPRATHVAPRA